MLNDLRYAFRQLTKNPGFTAVAVLTLALGIGATTAIFSVVYAVLLRPLPYREPERLVQLYETGLRAGGSRDWVSFPNFLDWRRQNQVFEEVAAYRYWPITVAGEGTPETLLGLQVTSGLFSVLGVHPSLGRTFLPEEDQPGKGNVAILSYGLWQRRFGGSQSIAGRPITIDGQSCTIVGVMPDGFQFPYAVPGEVALDGIALWIPMRNPDVQNRSSRNYWAIARLKRGVTLNQAQVNMDGIGAAIAQQYPNDNRDLGVKVTSLQQHLTREVNQPLWILLGAIGWCFSLLVPIWRAFYFRKLTPGCGKWRCERRSGPAAFDSSCSRSLKPACCRWQAPQSAFYWRFGPSKVSVVWARQIFLDCRMPDLICGFCSLRWFCLWARCCCLAWSLLCLLPEPT